MLKTIIGMTEVVCDGNNVTFMDNFGNTVCEKVWNVKSVFDNINTERKTKDVQPNYMTISKSNQIEVYLYKNGSYIHIVTATRKEIEKFKNILDEITSILR